VQTGHNSVNKPKPIIAKGAPKPIIAKGAPKPIIAKGAPKPIIAEWAPIYIGAHSAILGTPLADLYITNGLRTCVQ